MSSTFGLGLMIAGVSLLAAVGLADAKHTTLATTLATIFAVISALMLLSMAQTIGLIAL